MVRINDKLEIADHELKFTASRSGGPGGQNVNKLNTRVSLLFDLEASASLTEGQKRRLRRRLANRINKEGVLRVVSQRHRTQLANRNAAVQEFAQLLAAALRERKPRKKTSIPRAQKRLRLESKARRARLKRERSKVSERDW